MLTFQKFTKKILEIYVKKLSWENDWLERLYKWAYKKRRLVRANEPSACESKYTIGLREQMYEYHIGLWEQT